MEVRPSLKRSNQLKVIQRLNETSPNASNKCQLFISKVTIVVENIIKKIHLFYHRNVAHLYSCVGVAQFTLLLVFIEYRTISAIAILQVLCKVKINICFNGFLTQIS